MGNTVLNVSDLTIRFGGLTAVDGFSMHIDEGEFVGLIGPNGAGKTTFFNSLTGNIDPTEGKGSTRASLSPERSPPRSPTWASHAPSRTSAFSRR